MSSVTCYRTMLPFDMTNSMSKRSSFEILLPSRYFSFVGGPLITIKEQYHVRPQGEMYLGKKREIVMFQ